MAKEDSKWRVHISRTVATFFAKVIGFESVNIGASALAQCTTSVAGGYTLFAGGDCGSQTLDWSGSSNQVTGDVHSNGSLDMSGSDNGVSGNTTAVATVDDGGNGNTFDPPPITGVPWRPWPVFFDTADFLPGGQVASAVGSGDYHYVDGKIDSAVLTANGWLTGTILDDGVYVANGDIDLSGSNLTGTVTLVTAPTVEGMGVISLSGSDHNLSPFYQNLLLFSDSWKGGQGYGYNPPPLSDPPSCFAPAIKLAGSTHNWTGTIYAPRGLVDLSSSVNTTIDGSIVSNTIRLNGSVLSIAFAGAGAGGNPITVLVE